MLHPAARRYRFVIVLLIIVEIFGVGTPVAYAEISGLTSLLTSSLGSAAGAAISCNRGSITRGLGNLFGGGAGSSGSTTETGTSSGKTSDAPTTDGKLDLPSNGTDPWANSNPNDPVSRPGEDRGTSLITVNNKGQSATSPADDKGSGFSTGSVGNVVPVQDAATIKNTGNAAAEAAATSKKLNCTNAIQRAATQTILKQLTLTTVNWINHGFQGGSSFFPKDTGSFLKEIGDQTVATFVTNIGFDSKNYPFGRMVAQNLTSQIGSTFEARARYSLDAVLAQNTDGITPIDFENDFINGGWAVFNEQFNIANNPIGFQLAAQNSLVARTAGTDYSLGQNVKDQLQRAGGLLDTQICVAPDTYDAAGPGTSDPIAAQARIDLRNAAAAQQNGEDNELLRSLMAQKQQKVVDNTCVRWETQTPGSAVSSALNTALSSPIRQLEIGGDLSTDLTAIFNALTNQLVQKGLASLSDSGNGTSSGNNQTTYTNNGSYVPNVSIDGKTNNGTNFLSAGDAFQVNIFDLDPSGKEPLPTTTAPTTTTFSTSGILGVGPTGTSSSQRINLVGLINREQQMVSTSDRRADQLKNAFGWSAAEKAVWVNSMQSRDPNYTNLLGKQVNLGKRLIPAVYNLDFCVPGPHPGWQQDAREHLEKFLTDPYSFPQGTSDSDLAKFGKKYGSLIGSVVGIAAGIVAGAAIGATAGSVVPGLGTAIGAVVGVIVGAVIYAVSNDSNKRAEKVFAPIVSGFLNVVIDGKDGREHVNGYKNSTDVFYAFSERYITAMDEVYTKKALSEYISSDIIAADETEMANIPEYEKTINGNADFANEIEGVIGQLISLGKRIADLKNNTKKLDGFPGTLTCKDSAGATVLCPGPAPVTYQDFQDQLTAMNAVTSRSKLTAYQLELKRISDSFNLIAPDLLSESDITRQQTALDKITDKINDIASPAPGSLLSQCIEQVNQIPIDYPELANEDGAPMPPVGRIPFPEELIEYLSPDVLTRIKYSISFLPDYYYGQGDTGRSAKLIPNPNSKVPTPEFFAAPGENRGVPQGDPKKTIENRDFLKINEEHYPYALAGLEYVMGVY